MGPHQPFTVSLGADLVVHAADRVLEIDDLNLNAAGIEWNKRGVAVNEFLQSVSNRAVYAANAAWAMSGAWFETISDRRRAPSFPRGA